MQIIQSGVPFNFSYGAYDQASGLFIAASIYDMTSGSPVFIALVPMSYVSFGVYAGSYVGNSSRTYLVIITSFTSNTYQTVDTTRPPSAECYQGVNRSLTVFPFNYATFDLDPSLYVQAKVYNTTTGLPVYTTAIPMLEVANGVYYGAFPSVVLNNSYFIISSVYTDPGYTHVDSSRTPGNDVYQGSVFSQLQSSQDGPNILGVIDGNTSANYPYPSVPQLNLIQGETRTFVARIVGPNFFPFDSSDLTDIQIRFLGYNGLPIILSLSQFYGGISTINLEQSLYSVTLNSQQTEQFKTGEQLDFTAYLYFGNFAVGVYTGSWGNITFLAKTPGTFGNVTLMFDGISSIDLTLQEFAENNPSAPLIAFSSNGDIQAQSTLTFNFNATDGQTLEITDGGSLHDTYTFKNSPSGPFQVQISASLSGTIANFLTALNTNGGNNYNAALGPNGNEVIVTAGSSYLAANGNVLTAISSGAITVIQFAGGTSTITGDIIPPVGSLTLGAGTDNTRIANFSRSLNIQFPSV